MHTWEERIAASKAKIIVELGTGQGASGACIMLALPPDASFYTINYADGHVFGEQLAPWNRDPRLRRLYADTIDSATLELVPDDIDLLFVDTTHEAWHAATELRLWQDKLKDGALVIVDDLNHNDMMKFWDSIPYAKHIIERQGFFRYDLAIGYYAAFDKPDRSTYGGKNA